MKASPSSLPKGKKKNVLATRKNRKLNRAISVSISEEEKIQRNSQLTGPQKRCDYELKIEGKEEAKWELRGHGSLGWGTWAVTAP